MDTLVCEQCFNDVELKALIHNSSATGKCSFTHGEVPVLKLTELLDFFIDISRLFTADPNSSFTVADILQNDWMLFSDEEIAQQILDKIGTMSPETGIFKEQHVSYSEEIQKTVNYWETLKEEIKYQSRYLTNIQPLLDLEWDKLLGMKTELEPTKELFRARIHTERRKDCYPESEMGAPPKELSAPGRANVKGIPYLYLCGEAETVLYEVRASYLDEVSVGKFKQKDQNAIIQIADFTYTPSLYSSDADISEIVRSRLLRKAISADLSKPVRRYDSRLDYVPTQFICEFMRNMSGVDGVMFKSSLRTDAEGTNIVIFNPELMECVEVRKWIVSSVTIESQHA